MHELLAQLYGTKEKIASQVARTAPVAVAPAVPEETASPEEAQLTEFIVDEIVKEANAQGIDLRTVPDEDLVSLIAEYKAEFLSEQEKVASAAAPAAVGATDDTLVQADLVGRTIAHAIYDESNNIQNEIEAHEKLAGLSDEQIFDALASQRAENILQALVGNGEGFMKEASAQIEDVELDDLVTERAAEMLDAAGYDVDAIAAALAGE